jgi:hypothetical protein
MRQDPDSGRHQQPSQWQIPRQRVPYEESGSYGESGPYGESGTAWLGDRQPAASWHPFSLPMSDLTNPANQWSANQPPDGQQPLPVADTGPHAGFDPDSDAGLLARAAIEAEQAALNRQAVLRPGRRSASRMKAISLALAVAAALVFFVSLATRQLTIATAIATVALMLAALLNYGRLARRRG